MFPPTRHFKLAKVRRPFLKAVVLCAFETSPLRIPVSASVSTVARKAISEYEAQSHGARSMARIRTLVSGFFREGARESVPWSSTYWRSIPVTT